MPFGNPQRKKSFRCRSTHFFAKVSIFSLCVGVFNKKRQHERRTQRAKANALTIYDAPWFNKISSKTILFSVPATKTGCRGASPYRERKNFFFFRLPRVVAKRRAMYWIKYVFLLCPLCSAAIEGRPRRERPG